MGLAAISETARQAVWHDSFWLAFSYAGPLLALGWIRVGRRGTHILGPGHVVLGAGIHVAALFWYANAMGRPVLTLLGASLLATLFLGLVVRGAVHANTWFGKSGGRLVPSGVRERLAEFAAAVRRRPSASLTIAAGCALGGSFAALFGRSRWVSEALSNWAFFLFAVGVLIDLGRTVRSGQGEQAGGEKRGRGEREETKDCGEAG